MQISPKACLRAVLLDSFVWDFLRGLKAKREAQAWERNGRPVPAPHIIKQRIVSAYASAFAPRILIESGTCFGDMVYAMRDRFQRILSVELNDDLFKRARRRFRSYPHIEILRGDSGEVFPRILSTVSEPCLFWLDAHYSGGITSKGDTETPVIEELKAILGHTVKDHIILIDDARNFDGVHDYPTPPQLRTLVSANRTDYDFSVLHDVIRIHPKRDVHIML
jgi:hypothetical protein